jgi:hypothetical protein
MELVQCFHFLRRRCRYKCSYYNSILPVSSTLPPFHNINRFGKLCQRLILWNIVNPSYLRKETNQDQEEKEEHVYLGYLRWSCICLCTYRKSEDQEDLRSCDTHASHASPTPFLSSIVGAGANAAL